MLTASPADVTALFEMAFSYLSKRDFDKSFELAKQGAEFKSDLLPMFYDVMASSLESKGQPQQAVEMYRKGIALAPDASQLYFNMQHAIADDTGIDNGHLGCARIGLQAQGQ